MQKCYIFACKQGSESNSAALCSGVSLSLQNVIRSLVVPTMAALQSDSHALIALTSAWAAMSILTTTSKPPTAASCSRVHFSLPSTCTSAVNTGQIKQPPHLSRAFKSAPAPLAAWSGVCLKLQSREPHRDKKRSSHSHSLSLGLLKEIL
jgi:hypothetical protein